MNPMSCYSKPLAIIVTMTAMACSTIPKDAPAEFSRAEKEIASAKKENVSDVLPKTMTSAKNKLAQASDDWRNADAPKAQEAATAKAWAAAKMAEDARKASTKIRAWDENIEAFSEDTKIQGADSSAASNQPEASKLDELQFNKPIAYFNTGSARLNADGKKAIDDLANMLKKEPAMNITVIGRSDPLGAPKFNDHLCLERAQVVANELTAHGIDLRRVKVQTAAMGHGRGRMMGPGHMQLQRRVDVIIRTDIAH